MKVVIRGPTRFFSTGDEDSFFHWLRSIAAVKNVVGCRTDLEITLVDPVDDCSLRELIGLTTRYGLEMAWLRQLRNDGNKSWFDNENTFWYESVFN
jgi:hypothetical protein